MTNNNKPLNRESLRNLFQDGSRPNESNFASLIDSMINTVDDGIAKNIKDGLILSPEGSDTDRLVSFYQKITNENPDWSMELMENIKNGLGITEPGPDGKENVRMFFEKGGDIGIGTTDPKSTLDVNGTIGYKARVGTYVLGTVPADGKWHDVITDLNGSNAYEIVAQVGKEKAGRYALMQATAISTFGRSKSKIRKTQAYYGWFWNRIALRWRGKTFDYKLQMKTCSNYGDDIDVKFHIGQLWSKDFLELFNTETAVEPTEEGDASE